MNRKQWIIPVVALGALLLIGGFFGITREAGSTPTYTCDNVRTVRMNRTEFVFTTDATIMRGAVATGYNYNLGNGDIVTSGRTFEHVYSKPGTYVVTVRVNVKLPGGEVKSVTSRDCRTTVQVTTP